MFLFIYRCVPGIRALIHIGTEKYHRVSEVNIKSMKQKYRSNECMNDGGKKIEPIYKYVPSIMSLVYIETEKCHKIKKLIIQSKKKKYKPNPYM